MQLCSWCSLAKNLHVDSLFLRRIFILGYFFPPPHDCQCFRGYFADAGVSALYFDAVFLWMLKADVMVLFFQHGPPAPRTPVNKGRAGSAGW